MQDQAFLLPKGAAMSVLQTVLDGIDPSSEILRPFSHLVEVEGGFRGLHDNLKELTLRLGNPKSNDARSEFESEGCVIIHRALSNLPDELINDGEFWLWLTIYQCRDIVEWRHGSDAKFGNFGLEGKFEGLMCRMFMRAYLVFSETDQDPYELARRGTQDFWRAFMIRRKYGSVKAMARAFARHVNFYFDQALSDDEVRLLGPKVTQLNSIYSYELLSEAQCREFVGREHSRLFPSDGN